VARVSFRASLCSGPFRNDLPLLCLMAGRSVKRKPTLAKSLTRQELSLARRRRAASQAVPKGLTVLEAAAVRPSTAESYQRAVSEFIQ
jgi:hypothetical protein